MPLYNKEGEGRMQGDPSFTWPLFLLFPAVLGGVGWAISDALSRSDGWRWAGPWWPLGGAALGFVAFCFFAWYAREDD